MTKNTDILSATQEFFTIVLSGESGAPDSTTSRQDFETRYNRNNGLDHQEFVNV